MSTCCEPSVALVVGHVMAVATIDLVLVLGVAIAIVMMCKVGKYFSKLTLFVLIASVLLSWPIAQLFLHVFPSWSARVVY